MAIASCAALELPVRQEEVSWGKLGSFCDELKQPQTYIAS
jgi:hypothetical protein